MFWERWVIPIAIASGRYKSTAERERAHAQRQLALRDAALIIIQRVDAKKAHIPPVKSTGAGKLCYPFEISFNTGGKTDESWGMQTFKRILKQGPPMLMK
jgi:hypothetical protein